MSKKRIIFLVAFLLIVVLSLWRIISLNQQFSMWREETVYEVGETAVFHDFEMTVSDFEVLTEEQFKEKFYKKFNVTDEDFQTLSYKRKMLVFQLTARNISQEKKYLEWFNVQSGTFSNLADPAYFQVATNKNKSELNSEFLPGEEKSGYVVASYPESMTTSKQEWDTLNQKKYELVLTLYPKKVSMKLN